MVNLKFWKRSGEKAAQDPESYDVDHLEQALAAETSYAPPAFYDGDKFDGGFGSADDVILDYYTLRMRSRELFYKNLYARGMVRRLLTNEINTGLTVEAEPVADYIALSEDEAEDWSDMVERSFELYANDANLVDATGEVDFGKMQFAIRAMALVEGDVLVILDVDRETGLPKTRLVCGDSIRTPVGRQYAGRRIEEGVELDETGRHVAYHVVQRDGTSRRIRAYGKRSGRRIAKLIYGTERLHGKVRGEPLLGIVLQSLKELDRYRDATLRKAVVNSFIAFFIKKDVKARSSAAGALGASATRKGGITVQDEGGQKRSVPTSWHLPGTVIQELEAGHEPASFNAAQVNLEYKEFESAIVHAFAWAMEIPPTIAKLSFTSNYSASQGEINEFKQYLRRIHRDFAADYPQWVYQEWLTGSVLNSSIFAPGLLDAQRGYPKTYLEYNAWFATRWMGSVKPSADIVKTGKGVSLLIDKGLMTHDQASRETTGSKYSRNLRRLKREYSKMVEAYAPLIDLLADKGVNLIPEAKTIISITDKDDADDTKDDD